MARWAKDGWGSSPLGTTVANAKRQEVKEREQALLEQLELTFLNAEAPLFMLVQGKKHEELDCAASVSQPWAGQSLLPWVEGTELPHMVSSLCP